MDRPPLPTALDSEAVVLSTMLVKSDRMDLITPIVRAEMFFNEWRQRMFETILEVHQAGHDLDVALLSQRLSDKGLANMFEGGRPSLAIMSIMDAYSPEQSINVESHAAVVRDKWRLREMITAALRIDEAGRGNVENVQVFLDSAAARINELATPAKASSLRSMRDLVGETFADISAAAHAGRTMSGYETGFEKLDEKLAGWQEGDLIIVGARPSMGKTAFMMETAVRVAKHVGPMVTPGMTKEEAKSAPHGYNRTALVFSLEMPGKPLVSRSLCSEARVDSQRLRTNRLTHEDWQDLTAAAKRQAELPLFVDDGTPMTPLEIRATARRVQAQAAAAGRPLAFVAIDYVSFIESTGVRSKTSTREQEVAAISKSMKRLAKELRVPVMLLAQLKRVEGAGAKKEPELSDLRESGSLEQDADVVLFIHREEYYLRDKCPPDKKGKAKVIIAKQRSGPQDVVWLKFDGRFTHFSDLGTGFAPSDDHGEATQWQ